MENQEIEQISLNNDEKLFISAIIRSSFFEKAMKKAYLHGIEFEQLEIDGDMDVDNVDDKHLPFYEWFVKHYV
jgi:predicted restriction endonuclease